MHYACTYAGLVLSAHAHNIEHYGLVKVVTNVCGTRLAAATIADSNVRAGYVLYRALVSIVYHIQLELCRAYTPRTL